jgi:hypothetical protein
MIVEPMKKNDEAASTPKKASRADPKKKAAPPLTFLDLLANRSPEVQAIANRLRELVFEVLPKAEQAIYPNWRLALYRDVEAICAIQPTKEQCIFYFTRGAEMHDRDGLLLGVGRGIRHIKLRSLHGIPDGPIKTLLREGRMLVERSPRAVKPRLKTKSKGVSPKAGMPKKATPKAAAPKDKTKSPDAPKISEE